MPSKIKIILIFLLGISVLVFASLFVYSYQNQIFALTIPVWHGELDKPYTNYIIEGKIIEYDILNTDFVYLDTDYGVVKVSISELSNNPFYKRCNFKTGSNVRYAGMFSGKYNLATYFVLKRELC